MPALIERECPYPGCRRLITSASPCPVHFVPRDKGWAERPSKKLIEYGHRWNKARLRHLADSPLCAECKRGGRITPANIVDHIVPHRGDTALFWDQENWQSLCAHCHAVKTGRGQ